MTLRDHLGPRTPENAALHDTFGKSCRHWSGRDSLRNKGCGIGHPIERIVIAANGGKRDGIAYMFPCRPGPECKAKCPDYDPKTDAEIAAEKAALSARMDNIVRGMSAMGGIREKMIAENMASGVFDCPFCGKPNCLHVGCAIGYNNHLRASCSECGEGFIE